MLQHCKVPTILQEKAMKKYRDSDGSVVAQTIRLGAQEMRKHEWEFRSLPNSPEGEEKGWERMDTSASESNNSDSNSDSEYEGVTFGSNTVRQAAMNKRIMDDNDSGSEPTRRPTS